MSGLNDENFAINKKNIHLLLLDRVICQRLYIMFSQSERKRVGIPSFINEMLNWTDSNLNRSREQNDTVL